MGAEMVNHDEEDEKVEKKKIGPNDMGPGLIAPDGGWGWMIVVAAGFFNFCMLPVLQNFGLIFRDQFEQVGINASQTTTILNVNTAVMACVGLANGPLFRKYTYRQVCFVGALVCAVSICALSFMKTFYGVLVFMSLLYASGIGIGMSAVALALNTYFKKRRRIATGFSWTCTGLGPIIMPQVITLLMPIYGMSGTVLLFGGFALNAVACSLLLQPVSRHAKKDSEYDNIKAEVQAEMTKERANDEKISMIDGCEKSRSVENILRLDKLANLVGDRRSQRFGSQYLYYDDERDGAAGLDVIATGTPMMSRANDGWFSKRNSSIASLTSNKTLKKECSQQQPTSRRTSISLSRQPSLKALSSHNSAKNLSRQNSEVDRKRKASIPAIPTSQLIIVKESCETVDNNEPNEEYDEHEKLNDNDETTKTENQFSVNSSMIRRPIKETNESTDDTSIEGQSVLAHVGDYSVLMAVSVLIGIGKALRTIFMALVIPTHVPLERLPAASGLQLVTSGVMTLALGPLVGMIRDISGNYTIMLHCLNVLTLLTIVSWTLEVCWYSWKRKQIERKKRALA